MNVSHMNCCGLREIDGLAHHRTSEAAFRDLVNSVHGYSYNRYGATSAPFSPTLWNGRFRYMIFTQAGKGATYGDRFAEYILEHKLGDVTMTGVKVNPNSRNPLKTFVWTVDHPAVKRHITRMVKADAKPKDGQNG